MIKRITLATAAGPVWAAARQAASAPPDLRPERVTVGIADRDVIPEPRVDAVGLAWFADAAHLTRFTAWFGDIATEGDRAGAGVGLVVVEADEEVRRGADWLVERWQRGGVERKHLAIARRAPGLGPAEFRSRWQARAGQVAAPGGTGLAAIPDDVRGCAYVQNHPRPRTTGAWPYDAINEVYLADDEALRRRAAWFADLGEGAEADLVGDHFFVAVREAVVEGP